MSSPLLAATSVSAALAMGTVSVFFKCVQGLLEKRLQLTEGHLDRFNNLLLLSWIPLMPLAGWLLDHWGIQNALFAGSLILGLSVSWLAVCQNTSSLLWGVLGLGIAGGFISTASVMLMPLALAKGGWSVGASLCVGYVFVGLAALLTPVFLPWLAHRFGFRRTVLSLGLLCLLPAALVSIIHKENLTLALPVVHEGTPFDFRFWLIALVAFLYFPLEFSLDIWPRPYLAELGYSARSIVRLLVGFWCAFLVFRFGLGWMIRAGNEAWLVLVLALVSSMVVGNLAGAYAPSSGCFGFWLVGACYGPLLPALLGILLQMEGLRGASGQAVGLLFALGAMNAALVRPFSVAYFKNRPARAYMRIPMLLGLLMAAPLMVLAVLRFGR